MIGICSRCNRKKYDIPGGGRTCENCLIYARNYKRKNISIKGTKTTISAEKYEKMFMDQGGSCAICNRIGGGKRLFAVDHDHLKGTIRGLLCFRCNAAIGLFGDSEGVVGRALNYLKNGGWYGSGENERTCG